MFEYHFHVVRIAHEKIENFYISREHSLRQCLRSTKHAYFGSGDSSNWKASKIEGYACEIKCEAASSDAPVLLI